MPGGIPGVGWRRDTGHERRAPGSRRASAARGGRGVPHLPRAAQDLLRRVARRGQDLRHARGGPRQAAPTGVDVVIGWVETHGRAETAALAEGLERLAPREVELPRRRACGEFDLDARPRPPARRCSSSTSSPTRTRPGSRHAKRWQDARRAARGRHRRLHDAQRPAPREPQRPRRAQITGVTVRETVPDHLLDGADEVEFVDLPAEELLQRLAEGKVYVPDQAARAIQQLLPQGQPDSPCASSRSGAPPSAWTRTMRDYRRDHAIERDLAGGRAHPRLRAARTPRATALVRGGPPDGGAAAGGVDRGLGREPRASRRSPPTSGRHSWPPSRSPSSSGRRRPRSPATSVSEALLALRARAQRQQDRGRQAGPRAGGATGCAARSSTTLVRGSGELDVYVISGERGRAAPQAAPRRRPARASRREYLWSRSAVVAGCTLVCRAMLGRFDRLEPGHGLPARGGVRGVALRPGAVRARRRAERRRLRLLLRAALPHLRRDRHPVRRHLRGDARRGPARSARSPRGCGTQAELGAAAGAADAGPLRDEPRPRRPRGPSSEVARGRRATRRPTLFDGAAAVLVPGPGGGLEPVGEPRPEPAPTAARAGGRAVGLRPRAPGRARHRHAARRLRASTCRCVGTPRIAGRPRPCEPDAVAAARCLRTRRDLLEALARQIALRPRAGAPRRRGRSRRASPRRPSGCAARC